MKQLSLLLIYSFIVFPTSNVHAQDLNFPGIAPSLSISAILNPRLDLNFLTTSKIRMGDHTVKDVRYTSQLLQNYSLAVLSYTLTRHWQIGGGYGFEINNPFLDTWRTNQRLIQQVQYNIKGAKTKFSNRLRFEERWFRYHYDPPAFGTRVRYQAAFRRKLNEHAVYWQFNNELYAVPSGPRNALITEDWIYTGIGFPVKSLGHFETGIGFDAVVRDKEHDLNNLFLLQINWNFLIPAHKRDTQKE